MQVIALLMPWMYLIEAIVFLFSDKKENSEDYMENGDIVRIAMLDDKAYWVQDNIFYEADMLNGDPDVESARPIDAMTISQKEIDKLLYILDNLNED